MLYECKEGAILSTGIDKAGLHFSTFIQGIAH
jgi:hypothetical protein